MATETFELDKVDRRYLMNLLDDRKDFVIELSNCVPKTSENQKKLNGITHELGVIDRLMEMFKE